MTARIPYEFIDAIVGVHRDACRIHMPMVRGAQNNVLLAFVDNEMRVFKFEPQEMVLKNSFIAYTCRNNGVKVPNISVQEHNGMFFEEYPIIQGQTLYERIANNAIDTDGIRQVYCEVVAEFIKMGNIKIDSMLSETRKNLIHNIAAMNVKNTNGKTLAYVTSAIVYLLNLGRDKNVGLYHADITPKNIIVGPDGHFAGLVDVDTIALCNKNYAFANMAAKYQQLGFKKSELYDCYEGTSGDKLNRARVSTTANITNAGKSLLWHAANICRSK